MKKVGIMTFQFADNYGAVLQCYALQRVISDFPGCQVEIINYVPPTFTYVKRWNTEYEKHLFYKKRESFEAFLDKYCNLSGERVYGIGESFEYDYYCVGSDQIWNTNKMYTEYFLPDISEGAKRISYAASIGFAPDDYRLKKSVLSKYLPSFEHISVREQMHVEMVESITGRRCECVLDPTLLLNAKDYEELIAKEELRSGKFIFFYWLDNDDNLMRGVEFVNTLSRKWGIPIVHSVNCAPDFLFTNDAGNMSYESIENFLWYIKNAEYVITNSYHGTIFSILFRIPFYTFVVKSMRGRIDTLCNKLNIGDRVLESYLSDNSITSVIDFESIMEKLENERKKSVRYLHEALDI